MGIVVDRSLAQGLSQPLVYKCMGAETQVKCNAEALVWYSSMDTSCMRSRVRIRTHGSVGRREPVGSL